MKASDAQSIEVEVAKAVLLQQIRAQQDAKLGLLFLLCNVVILFILPGISQRRLIA